MNTENQRVRVLYSFPHKLGADRICYTAWQQVKGVAAAGADVLACPGVLHRPLPANVTVRPTLARGKLRIPYKLVGKLRALALHDRIIARMLPKLVGKIDIIHAWPAASLETLRVASELGIPTVLERPNAHTRFAFETVRKEFDRLGLELPPNDEYFFNAELLEKEEEEYRRATYLLCPSEFVVKTFIDQGFPPSKLLRHRYGFDETRFFPAIEQGKREGGIKALFVGVCAVRKGLHFALEAWLKSPASQTGTFQIAGSFLTAYEAKLAQMLSHPSVKVLGQRNDVPELMRDSDVLLLPSLEEGFPLVIAEAVGSGCVPLASEACAEICEHMKTGLVHPVGDVSTLASQFTMLHEDRGLLQRLREGAISNRMRFTWDAAGVRLVEVYRQVVESNQREGNRAPQLMPTAQDRGI